MLKKAGLLTRPTPARHDAPFHEQGRSKRRGEEVRTAHRVRPFALTIGLGQRKSPSNVSRLRETQRWASERGENGAWEKARLGAGVGRV